MSQTHQPLSGISEERIRVRYGETDQMGHAYYANYLYWFEQARGSWCRDRGFTYKSLEEQGLKLPVVEAHVRYRGEILYDDMVVVQIWLSEIRRASIRFDYHLHVEGQDGLRTEGYTWHVLMGPERKAMSVPPEIQDLLMREPSYRTNETHLSEQSK